MLLWSTIPRLLKSREAYYRELVADVARWKSDPMNEPPPKIYGQELLDQLAELGVPQHRFWSDVRALEK